MALANTSLRVGELDFDTIKANLKDYLKSQDKFTDYDFDGSGLNILLDVLAYNTHYMAYYLNMIGNEMFLDSALLRSSILSKAKMIGYIPTSRRSSKALVNITVYPPVGNTTSVLTLDPYTQFQSEAIDGVNYGFITLDSYQATKNLISNTFTFSNVSLTEGEHLNFNYTVDGGNLQAFYDIPNANVDTSTLVVTVQNSASDIGQTVYSYAADITDVSSNTNAYYLQAKDDGIYSVYFGDGLLGSQLSNNNIVILDYLVSSGSDANKANVFSPMATIGGFSNIVVSTVSSAAGSSDMETNDQIKFRAPISYAAQNRAVTVPDFYISVPKNYPNVDQISVWGGQDNDPVVYGKVFISIKPKSGFYLTNTEKLNLIKQIEKTQSVVTVTPEIVDPDYLYVTATATVYYNQSQTSLTPTAMAGQVASAINNYFDTNLGQFNTSLKVSNLQTLIDQSDASIQNSDLSVFLQKQITPPLNVSQNYTIKFNAPLVKGTTVSNKLFVYPAIKLLDAASVERTANIEEVPFSDTGVKRIDMVNGGSGYSFNPTVTIVGDGVGATAHAEIKNGVVTNIVVDTPGSSYTIASATITGDGTGASADVVLDQNVGTLRSFYYNDSGQKVIINSDAGDIDYSAGTITLNNFKPVGYVANPFYTEGVLTFNALSTSQTVNPTRNTIIVLDQNNPIAIQVTAQPI